jgi:DNA repair exonuclease SbcCD ATPase subunit
MRPVGERDDRQQALSKREAELADREERVARAEKRLREAVAAQKQAIQLQQSELERDRGARADLAQRVGALEAAIAENAGRETLQALARELRAMLSPVQAEPPADEATPTVDTSLPVSEWDFGVLERLVRERSPANRERADEWAAYLETMRPYVDPAGRLPASFDTLLERVFGEDFREAAVRRG